MHNGRGIVETATCFERSWELKISIMYCNETGEFFLSFGPLVPWSPGPLVLWSSGGSSGGSGGGGGGGGAENLNRF